MPWLEPAVRMASARRSKHSRALASAKAMIEGGWWTPWRKHVDGMTSSPSCTCGKPSGCLWHLLAECPQGADARARYDKPEVFKEADGGVLEPFVCLRTSPATANA